MIAQIISMVSESIGEHILDELLGAHGASFHLKPTKRYTTREQCSFFAIMVNATKLNEIAVGYQFMNGGATVVNPKDKEELKSWKNIEIIVVDGHV